MGKTGAAISEGKSPLSEAKTKEITEALTGGWGSYFKRNWMQLLVWAAFFLCGYMVATATLHNECVAFLENNIDVMCESRIVPNWDDINLTF